MTQRNSTRGPFLGSMDPFLGQQTSESRLPRLPRAIFDSRPARLVSRGEDAGDADPEHDVSCALAVHHQKTKVTCVSRWTAISEQRDTIARGPPSAHGPVRGGAPFCLLSSTKGGQFLRAASRLAFRVSSIPHWAAWLCNNRQPGRLARKGPALNGSPKCRQQVSATCRHQRVRSEEGCTLLLCDRPVRPGTWMESTTYCLSGKEGFKAACTADMGEGLVGMAGNGMLQTGFRNLSKTGKKLPVHIQWRQ